MQIAERIIFTLLVAGIICALAVLIVLFLSVDPSADHVSGNALWVSHYLGGMLL